VIPNHQTAACHAQLRNLAHDIWCIFRVSAVTEIPLS